MKIIKTEPPRQAGKFGSAKEAAMELDKFQATARIFSSNNPRLIELYPNEWVAAFDGRVVVHHRSRRQVMKTLRQLGIPTNMVMLRYIEKNHRLMVMI